MYFVYLLRCSDKSLYCGITNNLQKRLRMHNGEIKGGAKYTRGRRPVHLEVSVPVKNIQEALSLEREVKKKCVHQKINFLKSLTYNQLNMHNKEENPMHTLTFTFSNLQKNDLVTLFFTKQNQTDSIEKLTPLECCNEINEISLQEQESTCKDIVRQEKYAFCHDLEHALNLPIGTLFYKINEKNEKNEEACFCVESVQFHPNSPFPVLLLKCLSNSLAHLPSKNKKTKRQDAMQTVKKTFTFQKKAYSLGVITLSDKGFRGEREDKSGPALLEMVGNILVHDKEIFHIKNSYILPDEIHSLRGLVTSLAYTQGVDCIITTGGTGLSSRDITPDALLPLLQSRLHGFEQAMMAKSLEKTPHAMLSRAFVGIIHKSLVICVPGSVKAATENIAAILPALPHALAKLGGDMSDCGN